MRAKHNPNGYEQSFNHPMSPTVRATARRNGIFSMLTRRGFPLCETSLLYCPRLIQCAGYDSFGVRLWDLLVNGANRLIEHRQNGQNGCGVMLARNFFPRL
jgi:hypothetical protein